MAERRADVYVYAVLRAGTTLPKDVRGVGAPPATLRTVGQGPLDVVISDAPPQLRNQRGDLLAHQDLLLRLADEGPVLPMRFGMVAPDESTVLAQLAAAESGHIATLDRLAGRVEVNVKALPAQDSLAVLVAEEKNVWQLREDARRHPGYEANLRLGEAIAAALTRRATTAGERILRELAPRAHEVAAGPEAAGCVLNVSFLVDRGDTESFLTEARNLADAHREHVELQLAGPLPCYSFVSGREPHGSVRPLN
jgi:hypothetical protein